MAHPELFMFASLITWIPGNDFLLVSLSDGYQYLAAGRLNTHNRHIYGTAPSLLTLCRISFHTPTGAADAVKSFRTGRYL